MPVSGIQKLAIKNFKAFRTKEEFEINGRHLLIYGENGSGKSSLYFALYTLLQCATKTEDRITKYFDLENPENLVNIHNPDTEDAYVHLTLTNNTWKDYKISFSGLEGNDDTLKDVNLASDFISHRLLINFYNFRNSNEINLLPVFDRDIWPFTTPPGKSELFDDTIKKIREDIVGLERKDLKVLQKRLDELNKNILTQINNINEKSTRFITKHFFDGNEKYKIILEYIKPFRITGETREYKLLN